MRTRRGWVPGQKKDKDNGGPGQQEGQGKEEKGGPGQSRTKDKRRKMMGEGQRKEQENLEEK